MHTQAVKPHRIGFANARVTVGAVLHAGSLAATHLLANRWKSPLAKFGTYAAAPVVAGFVCKLLHERETSREKQLLGLAGEAAL